MNEIKKITDKQFRCLKYINEHRVLTPGDEENYKALFMLSGILSNEDLNAFQAKVIIEDFVEMTLQGNAVFIGTVDGVHFEIVLIVNTANTGEDLRFKTLIQIMYY